jgi:hypothetical protein
MMKKSDDDAATEKRVLIESINNHELPVGEAVRRMRKITGMSQKAYAERIVGLAPRIFVGLSILAGIDVFAQQPPRNITSIPGFPK